MMMFSINRNCWSQQISLDNLHSKGKQFEEYWEQAVAAHRSILENVKQSNADAAVAVVHSFIY